MHDIFWCALDFHHLFVEQGIIKQELNVYLYVCICFSSPGLSSPPATLYDRYSSPTANPTRRRLFADNDSAPEGGTAVRVPPQPVVSTVPVQNVSPEAVSVTPVPGQTLVTVATATVTANNGQTVTIPVQGEGKAAAQLFRLVPIRVLEYSQEERGEQLARKKCVYKDS